MADALPTDDENTPSRWVKVRAKTARGIIRGGIHWSQEESIQLVSPAQLALLQSEPMLDVKEIGEGEVPEGIRKPAVSQTPEEQKEAREREAELLKSAEFPNRGPLPTAQAARAAGVGVPDSSTANAARSATDGPKPLSPSGVTDFAQSEDPPGATRVDASAGLADDKPSSKKRH